ncbi:Aromatic-amino-acid aminotransferase [Pseudomonas fluorescens]|uniref:amino acid aminotransferase n=1 Tax=Pseudomonas fluorescens TaxID=294 RepID=UPI0012513646|nr:amino acid aminotransferase [Pseudomonas fluorescens]CAG8863604.1 Aromatic-amino-acid aminotransferase [Pseudomonas fluorescens]
MFKHVDAYAGDPILSLMETFKADPRADKVNLSIGLYYDAAGVVPQLAAVAEAEQRLAGQPHEASLYLPMEGLASYRRAIQALLFGTDHPAVSGDRVATVQTVGGSGALKVGADFLKRYFPEAEIWVSNPTWDNHRAIFEGAGFKVHTYPYFDPASRGLDFEGMLATLHTLAANSIVLLHPCCHNPTGVDLDQSQWQQVVEVVKARNLIPFLDIAYQGFGEGLAEDAYAIREMARAGVPCLVSNSFSKIFSLYGERVGGLSVVCDDADTALSVLGQLKATVRRNYSSPPNFGAQLVSGVLGDAGLNAQWVSEVEQMRRRILDMRQGLVDALAVLLPGQDFQYLLRQRGMFSYTGFSVEQVRRLRDEFGVYLIDSGRVCMAGLRPDNLPQVAEAFAAVQAR